MVHRDKSGKWRYRKRLRLLDGSRRRIFGTPVTNTKAAAEAAEARHIFRLLNPCAIQPTAKEVPTVRGYHETYLAAAAAHKPSTRASKAQIFSAYVLPELGDIPLDLVRQEDVDALVGALLEGRSRKTVNNILAELAGLMRYAARNGVISAADLRCFIEGDDVELVAVSHENVEALLAATDDPRYRAAILLACDAGLRVGEIRALQWGDVNEIGREIAVVRSVDPRNNETTTKSRKHRRVPLSDRLWSALRVIDRHTYVVTRQRDGRRISYWAVRDALVDTYDRANLTRPPKPWHCLRHTFGSELAARGVPLTVIRDLMGHESIATTLRYVHVDAEAKRSAIDALANGQPVGNEKQRGKKTPRNVE